MALSGPEHGIILPESTEVVVVGAGLGGLTCALELARQGKNVTVLERHRVAGGYAHSFRRSGYHFDISQRMIGGLSAGSSTHGFLQSLGTFDKLNLVRPKTLLTADFPGMKVELPNQREGLLEVLLDLSPGESEELVRLFNFISSLKTDVFGPLLDPEFDLGRQDRISLNYLGHSFDDLVKEFVSNSTLRAVIGQLWQYMGLPPSQASANFNACLFGSIFIEGTYQIVGGGSALVRSLVERLRELGGDCFMNAPVRKITLEHGMATGVELEDGRYLKAETVVSSANPFHTFSELIEGEEISKIYRYRLRQMTPSHSMYALYLGLDCLPSEIGIPEGTHFVNYTIDHDEAYQRLLAHDIENTGWNVVNQQGVNDSMSPDGCGIASFMELTPAKDWFEIGPEEYASRKDEVFETLMAKYDRRFPGLIEHTVVKELGTPRTMARYSNNHMGAVYGLAQTFDQSNNRRLSNRTPVPNLFLSGAWTWGGGGYEGAMMSGVQAAATVMRDCEYEYRALHMRLHPAAIEDDQPKEPVRSSRESLGETGPEEEHYRFSLPIRVYGDDLNSRGKADASSYIRYLDRGRVEAIEEICRDLGEDSWLEKYVINVYRIDAKCATVIGLSDQLEVLTGLRKISTHRASFDQRLVNKATGENVVDAVVEVLFLGENNTLVPVPEGITECTHKPPSLASDRVESQPFSDKAHFPFRTKFRVYYEDTDTQQITYHVSYVRFCERALFDLIRTVWPDMSTRSWMQKNRSGVSRLDVRYMNSSVLGEWLEVWTGVIGMTKYHLVLGQRIVSERTGKVVADCTTQVEFRDTEENLVPVPRQIVDITLANLAPGRLPGSGEK